MSRLQIFALVGPSGTGKSTVSSGVTANVGKFKVVYGSAQSVPLDNRLVLSKFDYLAAWFAKVLAMADAGAGVHLSDRCPYDLAAYVKPGDDLAALVGEAMMELGEKGIDVRTIYIRTSLDTMRQRIRLRLGQEPWRRNFHEDDDAVVQRSFDYFERQRARWDFTVQNEDLASIAAVEVDAILNRALSAS